MDKNELWKIFEKTGKMPEGLALGEWVYTDGINAFLDNGGEEAGFFAKMEIN